MGDGLGKIGHELLTVGQEASSAAIFAEELSRLVRPWIPHDAYLVSGADPATGASCMWLADDAYLAELIGRLHQIDEPLYWYGVRSAVPARSAPAGSRGGGGSPGPLVRPMGGGRPGEPRHRLLISLIDGRHVLGSLTLVRFGAHRFGNDDVARAGALAAPLTVALRRFVAGAALRPPTLALAPGAVTLGPDHTILGITQTARETLRALWPGDTQADDRELVNVLWNSVYLARQSGQRALSRIPTPDGWMAVHAEPLEPTGAGAVAVTIEQARGEVLLPVMAAWYRVTPAELGVVRHAGGGLAAKHIARELDLSLHTVHDHLRSVYRKTGVASRDELIAWLGAA